MLDYTIVLFARVSDNVLDAQDWPVAKLELDPTGGYTISAVHLVQPAEDAMAMNTSSMPEAGWSLVELARWTRYDPTGTHPEVYHELRGWTDRVYLDFMEAHEVRTIADRSRVHVAWPVDAWILRIVQKTNKRMLCRYYSEACDQTRDRHFATWFRHRASAEVEAQILKSKLTPDTQIVIEPF